MVIAPAQRRFTAVVYRRYTPGWKRRMPNTAVSGDNDGMPGPTITARVGDRVIVHFRNEDRKYRGRHSMHFHAFTYRPSSDGTYIPFVSGPGANVPVGGTFTYRLVAGPNSPRQTPRMQRVSLLRQEGRGEGVSWSLGGGKGEESFSSVTSMMFLGGAGST